MLTIYHLMLKIIEVRLFLINQCTRMLDVVYSKLEDIHKHDKTSSLSPAAMAIIAIAVSEEYRPMLAELSHVLT